MREIELSRMREIQLSRMREIELSREALSRNGRDSIVCGRT